MEQLECPYCDYKFKVDYNELNWEDGAIEDFECRSCEKVFEVSTCQVIRFSCEEKDDA